MEKKRIWPTRRPNLFSFLYPGVTIRTFLSTFAPYLERVGRTFFKITFSFFGSMGFFFSPLPRRPPLWWAAPLEMYSGKLLNNENSKKGSLQFIVSCGALFLDFSPAIIQTVKNSCSMKQRFAKCHLSMAHMRRSRLSISTSFSALPSRHRVDVRR